ncbi:ketopantoate reductase family protein [Syntrophomonas curvata]
MKLAIMGAGSLGTIVGARLSQAGYDVDLIDVNAAHVKAMNEKGAKIIGLMEMVQPVKALTPEAMTEPYDIMFYLTKTTQNESALKYVAKYLKPDGAVVCMQNGIPEDAVAEVIGKDRVIGGIVGWGATWVEPGVSKLTSKPENMTYDLGELDGRMTERLDQINTILQSAGIPEKQSNLIGIRWTKLTINSSFSTMSGVVAGTYGDVLDSPKALKCAAHIWRESLAVARAADVIPEPIQGFDIRILDCNSEKEYETKTPIFHKLITPHRGIRTGMLYDIEAGREPEIDTYNGIICKWGEKHGVYTPVNAQAVEIIRGMWEGRYKIEPANVDRMKLPELPAE